MRTIIATLLAGAVLSACSGMTPVMISEGSGAGATASFLGRAANHIAPGITRVRIDPAASDELRVEPLLGEHGGQVVFRPRSLLEGAIRNLDQVVDLGAPVAGEIDLAVDVAEVTLFVKRDGPRFEPVARVALQLKSSHPEQLASRTVECTLVGKVGRGVAWERAPHPGRTGCRLLGGEILVAPEEAEKSAAINQSLNSAVLLTLYYGLLEVHRELRAAGGAAALARPAAAETGEPE